MLTRFVLRGRPRARVSEFPGTVYSLSCPFRNLSLLNVECLPAGRQVKQNPMIKDAVLFQRLRHIRIVHDKYERLGILRDAADRKWRIYFFSIAREACRN